MFSRSFVVWHGDAFQGTDDVPFNVALKALRPGPKFPKVLSWSFVGERSGRRLYRKTWTLPFTGDLRDLLGNRGEIALLAFPVVFQAHFSLRLCVFEFYRCFVCVRSERWMLIEGGWIFDRKSRLESSRSISASIFLHGVKFVSQIVLLIQMKRFHYTLIQSENSKCWMRGSVVNSA